MNTVTKHIIAKDEDKVIGYALAMTREFRYLITALESMFAMLDKIVFEEKIVSEVPFMVMGQICVDSNYRGKGIFRKFFCQNFKAYPAVIFTPLFLN